VPVTATLLNGVVLALVPSLLYLLVLNAVDRYEKEPWRILFASIGLGAVVAPLLVIGLFAITGREPTLRPQFAPTVNGVDPLVPVVQEVVKGFLLFGLTHSIRDEFDDILDGVVYGAALGAGFGAAESFVHVAAGTGGLGGDTVVALLISGLGHAFYTAVAGACLGLASRLHDGRLAVIVGLYGIATAALLHALHDALPFMLARVVDQPDAALGLGTRLLAQFLNVLGIVTLAVIVYFALRREHRVLHDQLADEVASGVVSQEDYDTIGSIRRRYRRELGLLRSSGVRPFRTARRLYATEGELAFHKYRLAHRKRRRPSPERTDRLRDEIRRLRTSLEGGAA
jgi:protease PrsW